jgi:hypothetical protein
MIKPCGLLLPLVFPSLTCSQANVQKQKSAAMIHVTVVDATATPARTAAAAIMAADRQN